MRDDFNPSIVYSGSRQEAIRYRDRCASRSSIGSVAPRKRQPIARDRTASGTAAWGDH